QRGGDAGPCRLLRLSLGRIRRARISKWRRREARRGAGGGRLGREKRAGLRQLPWAGRGGHRAELSLSRRPGRALYARPARRLEGRFAAQRSAERHARYRGPPPRRRYRSPGRLFCQGLAAEKGGPSDERALIGGV